MSRLQRLFLFMMVGLGFGLAACGNNTPKAEDLKEEFYAYDLRFQLPKGWQDDTFGNVGLEVGGGFGFGSPNYAGLTYLRLHQGAGFAVLGDWDPAKDATEILELAFARELSEQTPFEVLGFEGTYAHGIIDQGQGIGVVHVVFEEDGDTRQFAFAGVIANDWEEFEPTFLEIVKHISFKE